MLSLSSSEMVALHDNKGGMTWVSWSFPSTQFKNGEKGR